MADWFYPALPTTGKPVTAEWGAAVQENVVAAFEGAVGAPRLAFPGVGSWYTTAGAVGSMIFGRSTVGDVDYGDTVAGSTLRPTSATTQLIMTATYPGAMNMALPTGSVLAGTWRCLGVQGTTTGPTISTSIVGATLFVRIA